MQTKIFFSRNKKGQAISRPPAEKILLTCIKKRIHRIFIVQTKIFFFRETKKAGYLTTTCQNVRSLSFKTNVYYKRTYYIFIVQTIFFSSTEHLSTIKRYKGKADNEKGRLSHDRLPK